MATLTRSYSFTSGAKPTESQWNVDIDAIIAEINGNLDNTNVKLTGATGIVDLATAQTITGRKTYTGGVVLDEILSVGAAGAGHVKIADIRWDPASGTLANNDGLYLAFTADDNAGTPLETEYARFAVNLDDITAASNDASIRLSVIEADTLTEALRVDVNGVVVPNAHGVLVGATAQVTTSSLGELQVLGTAAADSTAILGQWSAAATGPVLSFIKSRNATIGSSTIVQDNDVLGTIEFMADDGGDFATPGATVFARVNGTPGANDMPTELVFATTADGANSVTEQWGILAAGTLAPVTNDGAAIGTTTLGVSDLHLASGAVINFANSNYTATHTSGALSLSGDLGVGGTPDLASYAGRILTIRSTSATENGIEIAALNDTIADDDVTGFIDFVAGSTTPLRIARIASYAEGTSENSGHLALSTMNAGALAIKFRITNVGDVIPAATNKSYDMGQAGNAWDDCTADDFVNEADMYFLDDRDDLGAIKAIKGSGKIDPIHGYELIDDSTLPEWALRRAKKDIYRAVYNADGEKIDSILLWKEGEIMRDTETGNPFVSHKLFHSWTQGAVRQLLTRVEKLEAV